jgi:RNA polymerase sigma-70 factor, ECF subfamily
MILSRKDLNIHATRQVLADERASCMKQFSAQIELQEPNLLTRQQEVAACETRFTAFVERRSRFVFRIAYALLRNSYDAEDVVQETFLKIYRAGAWEQIKDENAFLARTAWRIAINKLPPRRNDRENVSTDLEIPSTDTSPEEAAITANLNSMVHRLVDALPEELRQPLALSTVEELNSREIARVMGMAEGTVRTRLMRAREILKQKLTAIVERRYDK